MSSTIAGIIQISVLVVALALAQRPLGDYMTRVYTSPRHLGVERFVYRLTGVDPDADQRWTAYLRGVLSFSAVGVLFLYLLQRVQASLPLSLGFPGVNPDQAFNTAVSFVTNTNWQSYSGEATMGHLVQAGGLAVQNFVSAAVGMAVAIALVRGFARSHDRPTRQLLGRPGSRLRAHSAPAELRLRARPYSRGVIQNFASPNEITTLSGGAQSITGGPVASQEAIKELGTNGGGFYNANSAHPFENPTPWTNLVQIFLLLLIPVSLPRTFGRLVGNVRQGYAILAAMAVIALVSIAITTSLEITNSGAALEAAGAATEGKEARFGVPSSSLFASATTLTSTGAVNSFHSSYTALGGGMLILNMALGEIAPGGVGSGLYGMLVLAILTVFIAGLMVGRTPEYVGKKITAREMKLVSLYILTTPALVLSGTALALALPTPPDSILNAGPHGLSEVLYAFTSASNNNGSAFAGLGANTLFYNTALGMAMVLGRFLPIVFVLALAGSLARQAPVPETAGTLPTTRPQYVAMLVGVVVILVALTYFPALALGPLAEGLS